MARAKRYHNRRPSTTVSAQWLILKNRYLDWCLLLSITINESYLKAFESFTQKSYRIVRKMRYIQKMLRYKS